MEVVEVGAVKAPMKSNEVRVVRRELRALECMFEKVPWYL